MKPQNAVCQAVSDQVCCGAAVATVVDRGRGAGQTIPAANAKFCCFSAGGRDRTGPEENHHVLRSGSHGPDAAADQQDERHGVLQAAHSAFLEGGHSAISIVHAALCPQLLPVLAPPRFPHCLASRILVHVRCAGRGDVNTMSCQQQLQRCTARRCSTWGRKCRSNTKGRACRCLCAASWCTTCWAARSSRWSAAC